MPKPKPKKSIEKRCMHDRQATNPTQADKGLEDAREPGEYLR